MKKKLLIVLPLLLLLVASAGVAFARQNVFTPPPEFNQAATDFAHTCPDVNDSDSVPDASDVAGCDALANDGATAVTTYGANQYNQGLADQLKNLGLGKNYCFFEGQYAVNSQTCNQQLPPPINNCSGVFKGGLLSPVLATSELGGFGTVYLFESNAGGCGSVWAAFHIDANSTHTVSAVTVADQGGDDDNQSAGAYLTLPRSAGLNDWTSTYMIDYVPVPGRTYQASATVDGLFVTASYTIPV